MNRERGSVAIEMVLAIGLLLVPIASALAQVPAWVATSQAANAAAVEAARQIVLAETLPQGLNRAEAVAMATLVDYGFDPSDLVEIQVDLDPPGELQRGQQVTVTIRLRGSPIVVPGFGPVGNPYTAHGAATERVDDYRSFGP